MGAPGCDDAPVVTVPLGPAPRDITLVMPYYDNFDFLSEQVGHWRMLPGELQRHLSVVIVDDGTPHDRSALSSLQAHDDLKHVRGSWSLYRILTDVRWNWLAARNIGAHHARTQWVMLTDMDHVLPERTLRTLVYGQHDEGKIYRFSRTGTKTHPHPNSWFMTRAMYWKVGGYDEALSGHYGTDGEYRRRCAATARIEIMDVPLELHEHEGDSSTTHYLRKQAIDARGKQIIKARPRNWRPKVLSFPYHEVAL